MSCRLSLAISMPVAAASLTETVKVIEIVFSAHFRPNFTPLVWKVPFSGELISSQNLTEPAVKGKFVA